jgi:hypothetical protein
MTGVNRDPAPEPRVLRLRTQVEHEQLLVSR